MNTFTAFYRSSVGKKIVMSLSGLFLCTFLIVHAAVNLFLFAGKEAYDAASHFMSSNPLIRTVEVVLFAGLVLALAGIPVGTPLVAAGALGGVATVASIGARSVKRSALRPLSESESN